MRYNQYTLNSPYTEGLTGVAKEGCIITCYAGDTYSSNVQLALARTSNVNNLIFIRNMNTNGIWNKWQRIIKDSDIYIYDGETVTKTSNKTSLSLNSTCFVSDNATNIFFDIPITKKYNGTKENITVNNFVCKIRDATGGYLESNNTWADFANLSGFSIQASIIDNFIRVSIKKTTGKWTNVTTGTDITNNSGIVVAYADFSFTI